MRRFQPEGWRELADGSLMVEQRSYDVHTGRSAARWVIVRPDGERRELTHSVRLYTYPELARMLAAAGLEPEGSWGDADGSELGLDSRRMAVLARKRSGLRAVATHFRDGV